MSRGGSRVVQVISRNHSNFSKPAFVISQVLSCSSRNQLSFLFYCLLWSKTKKKASYFVIPSIKQQTQPFPSELDESPFARFRLLSRLPSTTRKHFVCTTGQNLYAVGGTGWDWMVYGSFHKSLKTLFDWPETLTLSCELLKLGCDWLSRPQTTVETTDNRI